VREVLVYARSHPSPTLTQRVRSLKPAQLSSVASASASALHPLISECFARLSEFTGELHSLTAVLQAASGSEAAARICALQALQFVVSEEAEERRSAHTALDAGTSSVCWLEATSIASSLLSAVNAANAMDTKSDQKEVAGSSGDAALGAALLTALSHALRDTTVAVAQSAVQLIRVCITQRPAFSRALLSAALPSPAPTQSQPHTLLHALCSASAPRPDCIARVVFGAITRVVDSARPLRTAALECLSECVEGCAPLRADHVLSALKSVVIHTAAESEAQQKEEAVQEEVSGSGFEVMLLSHALLAKLLSTGLLDLSGTVFLSLSCLLSLSHSSLNS
jgi:hypothetical protein